MNMIMKTLIDHKKCCEDLGCQCSEEKHIKVKVAMMSECGLGNLCEDDGVDSLAMFVTCENCNFFDFVTLYWVPCCLLIIN